MSIRTCCPTCSAEFIAAENSVGRLTLCPHCRSSLVIAPGRSAIPAAYGESGGGLLMPVGSSARAPRGVSGRRFAIGAALLAGVVLVLLAMFVLPGLLRRDRSSATFGRRAVAQYATLELSLDFLNGAGKSDADFIAHLDRRVRLLREETERVRGDQRVVLQALTDLLSERRSIVESYQADFNRFLNSGGVSPSGISERETLNARIALAKRFQGAAQQLKELHENSTEKLKERVAARGLSPANARRASGFWRNAALYKLQTEVLEADLDWVAQTLKALGVLDKHFGAWVVDERAKVISWDKTEQAREYVTLTRRLEETATRMQEMHRRALQQ